MDQQSIDYTLLVVDDVMKIIFNFVPVKYRIIGCNLVCRRWRKFFVRNYWENLSKQLMVDILKKPTFTIDKATADGFDIGQTRFGKPWSWLAFFLYHSSVDVQKDSITLEHHTVKEEWAMRIMEKEITVEIPGFLFKIGRVGKYVGQRLEGHSLFTCLGTSEEAGSLNKYEGHKPSGHGACTSLVSGVVHDGIWKDGRYISGTVCYPDGLIYGVTFIDGIPDNEIRHPKILECIEEGKCTNMDAMPQKMYRVLGKTSRVCEACAKHCVSKDRFDPKHFKWFMNPSICQCSCMKR